jgi:hypothetical protein
LKLLNSAFIALYRGYNMVEKIKLLARRRKIL